MWFSGKGKMNEYYIQKEFLIVNPLATETTGDYDEKNAGILYSDINAYIENADVGLYDLVKDYSEIINSIDTSIRALSKNSKVIAFLTGSTQSFVSSAKQMINTLLNSDDCIGVMEESLVDSIKVNPISEKMDYKFSELIKARQYYISDFYQKIGISANMNMKAERLTDNESQLIDSCAEVDFEHIIDNLNFSVAKINELFDLNISFRLNEDEVVNNYDKGDEIDGEENGTGTGTDNTGNGVQGTETPQLESRVSGEQNVSSGNINGKSDTENNAVGENSDEQGTNPEISDENSEVEVNVNIEVNAETAETEVVDNSDDTKDSENETTEEKEDEKKEVE
jgi:hypothetical protein